ncbi:transposase [Metallumcola ferriviriculae]|uniref:Transposase n=1 Tax=Metallumcola ferriviriculae TaxID=3039180 RepID=A0AAU0UNS0_9FIRM|nr:transposase [Desulfitibacteraceae bacterium MK1]
MQNQRSFAKELAKGCRSIEDAQEKMKELFGDLMQEMFEAEMDEHLGYEKHSPSGNGSGNSRNGYSQKTVKTSLGKPN